MKSAYTIALVAVIAACDSSRPADDALATSIAKVSTNVMTVAAQVTSIPPDFLAVGS